MLWTGIRLRLDSQPFLHVVQANTVRVGPRGPGSSYCKGRDFNLKSVSGKLPTKGKCNIEKIQRAAQNMAEVDD
ncbi:hypothetical protein WJX77_004362 [Trebouxia sp. C0004]